MRRAFALLELLLALIIFSILIISSSKILLSLTKDRIAYSKNQMREIEIQNALLLLSKHLKYSFITSISPTSLTLYPLNLSIYFSPTFSPIPKSCNGAEIEFVNSDFIYSKLDSSIIKVVSKRGAILELERAIQCDILYPLSSPIKLSLSPQNELLLNSTPLLKEVKKLEFHKEERGIKVVLCECEMFMPWSEF